MKHLKLGGLVAVLTLAAVTLIVAGMASATVLCKEEKNPCGSADYPAGTALSAELVPADSVRWKGSGGETIDTCSASTFAGKTNNTGGATSAVSIALSSLTWSGCTNKREVLKAGELEVTYAPSEFLHQIATLKIKGTEWKEGTCVYAAGSTAYSAGWVTEPKTEPYTVFDLKVSFPRVGGSFLCQSSQLWEGMYRFTTPSALYIAQS